MRSCFIWKTHTLWIGSRHSLFFCLFSSLLFVFCLFPENNVIGIFSFQDLYQAVFGVLLWGCLFMKDLLSLSYVSTLVFIQKVLILEVKWKGISKRVSRYPSLLSSLGPSKSLTFLLLFPLVGFLVPFFPLYRPRPRCAFHFSTLISVLTLLHFSCWSNQSLCFSFFCISWLSL